jgi:predicted TPR repeat methyltransferase
MTLEQIDLTEEKKFLNAAYATYTVDNSSQTRVVISELVVRAFKPYLRGGRGLELGCSDGYMTEMLANNLEHLDVVDGSTHFLKEAKKEI